MKIYLKCTEIFQIFRNTRTQIACQIRDDDITK